MKSFRWRIESLTGALLPLAFLTCNAAAEPVKLVPAACGVRHTLWIEHYAAQLYVPQGESMAAVGNPGEPKLLRLRILNAFFMPVDIPKRWRNAIAPVLDQPTIKRLAQAYEELESGDELTLAYAPAEGVELRINGRKVAQVNGHAVIDALIQTWARDEHPAEKLARAKERHPCA